MNETLIAPEELKLFLDEKVLEYDRPKFITSDPIQVPHDFERKEDIEIIAFLSASIAWGQRPVIIRNARKIADTMGNNPYEFLMQAGHEDWIRFEDFKHRTFNGIDLVFFLKALKRLYTQHGGLEGAFAHGSSAFERINHFRELFFEADAPARSQKHVSCPAKGSASKRINMFLRWMVRPAATGVDFGLWKNFPTSQLMMPLDVHTGNIARKLGLLSRKQNDWKALEELMEKLRQFDENDPVKYDFALFGLGAFESF